eukprot:jgi/Botrbrau1/19310/Bobra.0073s0048.2
MPATFVCCSSAGIFLYAMSKERELERAWHQKQLDRLRGWYAEPTAPLWLPRFLKRWWLQLQDDWEQLSTCQRLSWSLIGLNTGVFLLWRVPALRPFMIFNFTQKLPPSRTPLWTLFTCNFSHPLSIHFLVNMYALHWLVAAPCAVMAAPQTGALYMSAGLFSSLASHLGGLLGVRGTVSSSVGASGAIYGCAAATAVLYPDLQAGIIFIPGFHMPLSSLFPLLLGVDVLGVLLRWRLFDHWGHLGGALFGYMYTKYGQTIIWEQRDRIMAALGK